MKRRETKEEKGGTGETVIMSRGGGRKESGIALQGPSLDSLEQLWDSPSALPLSLGSYELRAGKIWLFGIRGFTLILNLERFVKIHSLWIILIWDEVVSHFLFYDNLITHDSPLFSELWDRIKYMHYFISVTV